MDSGTFRRLFTGRSKLWYLGNKKERQQETSTEGEESGKKEIRRISLGTSVGIKKKQANVRSTESYTESTSLNIIHR